MLFFSILLAKKVIVYVSLKNILVCSVFLEKTIPGGECKW